MNVLHVIDSAVCVVYCSLALAPPLWAMGAPLTLLDYTAVLQASSWISVNNLNHFYCSSNYTSQFICFGLYAEAMHLLTIQNWKCPQEPVATVYIIPPNFQVHKQQYMHRLGRRWTFLQLLTMTVLLLLCRFLCQSLPYQTLTILWKWAWLIPIM